MKKMILVLVSLASVSSLASNNFGQLGAKKAALNMIENDVRTVIKEVENTDDNPCMPTGKSYQVELQTKQASFDYEKMQVVYNWETSKTIGVDNDGKVMEVCAE